MELGLD
jgi:two-component system response regulator